MKGPAQRRRPAWLLAGAVLVLLVLATVWYYRDLPRRKVEQALGRRLGADVRVGVLAIEGRGHFILRDIVVRRMGGQPRLDTLRIGTLDVSGSLGAILDARFEALHVFDLEARLLPAGSDEARRAGPEAEGTATMQPVVGRLTIERGRVLLGGQRGEGRNAVAIDLTADLSGIGGDLAGKIRLKSGQIPIEALRGFLLGHGDGAPQARTAGPRSVGAVGGAGAATASAPTGTASAPMVTTRAATAAPGVPTGAVSVPPATGGAPTATTLTARAATGVPTGAESVPRPPAGSPPQTAGVQQSARSPSGTIEGFEATVRISEQGRDAVIEAASERIVLGAVSSAGSTAIPRPTISVHYHQPGLGEPIQVEAQGQLGLAESAAASARLDPATWSPTALTARVRRLDLGPVLLLVGALPEGWIVAGTADLDMHGSVDSEAALTGAATRVPTSGRTPARDADLAATAGNTPPQDAGRTLTSGGRSGSLEFVDYALSATFARIEIPSGGNILRPEGVSFSAAGRLALPGILPGGRPLGDAGRAPGGMSPPPPGAGSSPGVVKPSPQAGASHGAEPRGAPGAGPVPARVPLATIAASLQVGGLHGALAGRPIPEGIVPARASFEGQLDGWPELRLEGRAGVETLTLGSIDFEGAAGLPAAGAAAGVSRDHGAASAPRPSLDLRWTWSGIDLKQLASTAGAAGFEALRSLDVNGAAEMSGTVREAADGSAFRIEGTATVTALELAAAAQIPSGSASRAGACVTKQALQRRGRSGLRSRAEALTKPAAGPHVASDSASWPVAGGAEPRAAVTTVRASRVLTTAAHGHSDARTPPAARARHLPLRSGAPPPAPAWSLANGAASAMFAWRGASAPVEVLDLKAAGAVTVAALATVPATVSASGSLDLFQGTVRVDQMALDAPGLLHAQAHGQGKLWRAGHAGESISGGSAETRTGGAHTHATGRDTAPPAGNERSPAAQAAAQAAGARSPDVWPLDERSSDERLLAARPSDAQPPDARSPDTRPSGSAAGPPDVHGPDEARATASVHLERIDTGRWRTFLKPIIGDPAPGYTLTGTGAVELDGTLGWDGTWSAKGKAALRKNGFSSEDGAQVLEGLDMTWDVSVQGTLAREALSTPACAQGGTPEDTAGQPRQGTYGATGERKPEDPAGKPRQRARVTTGGVIPEDTAGDPAEAEPGTIDQSAAAALGLAAAPIVLHATADVGGFQLLWGSFFADGAALASKLEVSAELTPGAVPVPVADGARNETAGDRTELRPDSPGRMATRAASSSATSATPSGAAAASSAPAAGWALKARAAWSFPQGPRAEASLAAAPGAPLAYTLALQADDLGATVARYLRAPLGDAIPLFKRIEAGGALRAEARGTLSDGARALRGRLRLEKMRLAGTDGIADVQGLDLDLPMDIRWGAPGPGGERPISGEELEGSLRFSRLGVKGLEITETETGLRVQADTIALKDGLAVALLGGSLGIEQLTLAQALRPARRAEAVILLEGVDLAEVTRAFGLFPLEGKVSGYFPKVIMTPSTLKVVGGGTTRIFGGDLELGEISGQDLLTRYPKLTFSAQFKDIDIGQLTRKIDFGETTGIVQGFVKDCELFGGVPVAFEAQVETVEKKGVPRTVNVKAIKNLTILGTGARVNVFDRGIQKFFDKYTYSRIGVHVSLRNDELLLTGLEHGGGRELFVKGRLPFPINVVNAQPGRAVSFQDMVERLRNLDLGAATVGQ